jgi:DNA-binding Lrp family transcriptional regulator
MKSMDKIDVEVLEKVTRNPQKSFSRIAEELGISPITVQRRFKKMKEEGILLQSSIAIDLSKIGYQGKAYLMITTAPSQDKTTVTDALMSVKDVFIVTEITGDFDILAIAAIKSFKHVIDLVNTIKKLPNVDQVEVAFTTDTAFPVDMDFNTILGNRKDFDNQSA